MNDPLTLEQHPVKEGYDVIRRVRGEGPGVIAEEPPDLIPLDNRHRNERAGNARTARFGTAGYDIMVGYGLVEQRSGHETRRMTTSVNHSTSTKSPYRQEGY
jgi:hypothetical protein